MHEHHYVHKPSNLLLLVKSHKPFLKEIKIILAIKPWQKNKNHRTYQELTDNTCPNILCITTVGEQNIQFLLADYAAKQVFSHSERFVRSQRSVLRCRAQFI